MTPRQCRKQITDNDFSNTFYLLRNETTGSKQLEKMDASFRLWPLLEKNCSPTQRVLVFCFCFFYSCFFFSKSQFGESLHTTVSCLFIVGWLVVCCCWYFFFFFFYLMAVKCLQALTPGLVTIFPERPTVVATSVTLERQSHEQCNQWTPARGGAGLRL